MLLEIITPQEIIFKGKVNSVKVPGGKSPFQILKNHAPIISNLEKGNIVIDIKEQDILLEKFKSNKQGDTLSIEIEKGILKNQNNIISILLG